MCIRDRRRGWRTGRWGRSRQRSGRRGLLLLLKWRMKLEMKLQEKKGMMGLEERKIGSFCWKKERMSKKKDLGQKKFGSFCWKKKEKYYLAQKMFGSFC